ncbi:MAG: hypothetical protein PHY92_04025 [Alphaproteobacteria bacterium]|nr:hypothetical protein [Alphaproteobacteria bacterium]
MKCFGKWRLVLVSAVLTMAIVMPALAQDMPVVKQRGGVSFVTGGIGLEERDAIKATAKDYNLLVSNANKGGHMTTDVELVIKSLKDEVILAVEDAGPLFYANLPEGSYIVEAMNGEQYAKRRITVGGKRQAKLYFVWGNGALCSGKTLEAPKAAVKQEPKKAEKSMKKDKAEKAPKEVKKETSKEEKAKSEAKEAPKEVKKEATKEEKAKGEAKEAPKEVKKEEPKDKKAKEAAKEEPKKNSKDAPKKDEPKSPPPEEPKKL